MSKLRDIPIRIESAPWATGNALPILHEIRHALVELLESGRETAIDLKSLPLGPGDDVRLLEVLGSGEVTAQLTALGKSTVRETRFGGVWFIEHFDTDEQLMGRYIEVTPIPSILKSPPEDIREGVEALTRCLNNT